MSDARSLTPLSEMDYEAIAEAVMETARGRWFLAEYAKRNRHSDTELVLGAIGRLERACGVSSTALAMPSHYPVMGRAMDRLRGDTGTGPAEATAFANPGERIAQAAANILTAAENIQEAAWTLREAGADNDLCDQMDRRATQIYAATADIEALAEKIGPLAAVAPRYSGDPLAAPADLDSAAEVIAFSTSAECEDFDILEIGNASQPLDEEQAESQLPAYRRLNSAQSLEDDIVFAEEGLAVAAESAPATSATAFEVVYSEADLRAINALPAEERLKFFA